VRNPIISSVVYLSSSTTNDTTATAAAAGSDGSPKQQPRQQEQQEEEERLVAAGSSSSSSSSSSKRSSRQPFVGGPTLVTDQRLGRALATEGWLAYPATNRVTFFNGSVLHGEKFLKGCALDYWPLLNM